MLYDIEEVLIQGIMTDRTQIIVEGKDDISIYSNIARMANIKFDIIAVENIEGCSEGCSAIIQLFEKVQLKFDENEKNEKFLIGIIDRDSRYYRGEIPDFLKGIFVLNKYSIENHFITDENIKYLLNLLTGITPEMITEDLLLKCKFNYVEIQYNLFLIGLESLKRACINGYDSVISYKDKAGYIYHNQDKILDKIKEKEQSLLTFAESKSLSVSDVKTFVKGKWILYFFCANLQERFNKLTHMCCSGEIEKCQFCQNGKSDKCLYKMNLSYSIGHIYELIKKHIYEEEVKYIIQKLCA